MKRLYFFLIITFALLNHFDALAQYSFKNQRNYKPFGTAFIDTVGIGSCSFISEILEIRFWRVTYTNTAHQLFILQQTNTQNWVLKKYSFCSWDWKDFSNIKMSTPALSPDWNLRWDSLMSNQFLTMPTQSEIQKKWSASDGTVAVIADGHKYVVELLTKKKKRSYSYLNPESNLRHYDLGNSELIQMNKILKLLDDELKFNSLFFDKCD
jgi:hypothetical protein